MEQKAIILCNGQMPPQKMLLMHLEEASIFIAADGGANSAAKMGLRPDVVIGDIDSFDVSCLPSGSYDLIHDTDQETNDLEKVLKWLQRRGIKKATVFGATNMRMDHSLKNLSVMLQFHSYFDELSFKDQYGYCLILPRQFSTSFPKGTTLSLLPLNGRVEGITTKGLKYPLIEDFLENGIRDGSSNENIEEHVSISHKNGALLLYVAN